MPVEKMTLKTQKQIRKKAEELRKKADYSYKEGDKVKDTYAYGQYLILKWVLGESTIK